MDAIGQVLGFNVVGVHRQGLGLRVDVGAGDIRLNNKQRHYPVAVYADESVPKGAKRARAYFIDPEVSADTFEDGSSGWAELHMDYDASTPRGVYPNGVIVVAIVEVPPMDRRSRGEHGALVKNARSLAHTAMRDIRAEFDRWQAGVRTYQNDADFARQMQVTYATAITSEGSIKNACTRWRREQ